MRARVLVATAAAAFVMNACASSDGQPAPEATAREQAALRVSPPSVPPPPATCVVDADCRLFDDYCGGCDCRAIGANDANPACKGKTVVACFVQPCREMTAMCIDGTCAASAGAF